MASGCSVLFPAAIVEELLLETGAKNLEPRFGFESCTLYLLGCVAPVSTLQGRQKCARLIWGSHPLCRQEIYFDACLGSYTTQYLPKMAYSLRLQLRSKLRSVHQ